MPLPIETPYRIEPCLLESIPIGITALIANLTASSERIASQLHPRTATSLAELVRIMNCYYSNLIEGHNTKPRDIERALANDLEKDELRRNFQIEARAHVRLQRMIDRLYSAGNMPEPASTEFLRRTLRHIFHILSFLYFKVK
jgi:Fic family protein